MSHSYSNTFIHAIFSTKNRANLIPPEFEKRLYFCIALIAREEKVPLVAAGGTANHSHLLFLLPAKMSLVSALSVLKANSSRFLSDQGLDFEWQKGYGAFSVSASNVENVSAYIRNRPAHHSRMTFEQEFIALLTKAGVPYYPQYVFG